MEDDVRSVGDQCNGVFLLARFQFNRFPDHQIVSELAIAGQFIFVPVARLLIGPNLYLEAFNGWKARELESTLCVGDNLIDIKVHFVIVL